jgi:hypothetical protein
VSLSDFHPSEIIGGECSKLPPEEMDEIFFPGGGGTLTGAERGGPEGVEQGEAGLRRLRMASEVPRCGMGGGLGSLGRDRPAPALRGAAQARPGAAPAGARGAGGAGRSAVRAACGRQRPPHSGHRRTAGTEHLHGLRSRGRAPRGAGGAACRSGAGAREGHGRRQRHLAGHAAVGRRERRAASPTAGCGAISAPSRASTSARPRTAHTCAASSGRTGGRRSSSGSPKTWSRSGNR